MASPSIARSPASRSKNSVVEFNSVQSSDVLPIPDGPKITPLMPRCSAMRWSAVMMGSAPVMPAPPDAPALHRVIAGHGRKQRIQPVGLGEAFDALAPHEPPRVIEQVGLDDQVRDGDVFLGALDEVGFRAQVLHQRREGRANLCEVRLAQHVVAVAQDALDLGNDPGAQHAQRPFLPRLRAGERECRLHHLIGDPGGVVAQTGCVIPDTFGKSR